MEKWVEGCTKSATKLSLEIAPLDGAVNSFIASAALPVSLSEAVLDGDYTLLAAKRYGEIARDFWSATTSYLKKLEASLAEPFRNFSHTELRTFKDSRRQLEQTQKSYDNIQARFSAQVKSKEPSALREDAFQLHEARKAYLKASLDYACAVPLIKHALDKLLVTTFTSQSFSLRDIRESSATLYEKHFIDLERIRSWLRNVSDGERLYRREFLSARRQIEEFAETASRPSRELEDYSANWSARNPGSVRAPALVSSSQPGSNRIEKQGWLNLKTNSGKPIRTVWSRKWFYIKRGIFGWLMLGSKSFAVEESDRIGVLLCGVRVAVSEERRFCFEVKTRNGAIILQAESHQDLLDWMATFEGAKQNALKGPVNVEHKATASQTTDLAFSISPPSVPEFAASAIDAGLNPEEGHEKAQSFLVPSSADQVGLMHRGSFDVSAGRRSTGLDVDTSREQSSRVSQRPESHRKSGVASSATGQSSASLATHSSGGVASLISASNMALSHGTMAITQSSAGEAAGRTLNSLPQNRGRLAWNTPPSTLAPNTLANPPNATNLSWAASAVNGERGRSLGWTKGETHIPNVVVANLWGTSNWGRIHWLERPEGFTSSTENNMPSTAQQASPRVREREKSRAMEGEQTGQAGTTSAHGRLKDSTSETVALRRTTSSPENPVSIYPALLKHQDSQFRLLFPEIPDEERLLLVFRAFWSLNEQYELPGRVYVTSRSMFFYCHHFGMVLITGLSLDRLSSVSTIPGRDFDFLSLQLKDNYNGETRRITIKVFLEPVKVLRRRLNLLVQNAKSAESSQIEYLLKDLLEAEIPADDGERSPSIDSHLRTSTLQSLKASGLFPDVPDLRPHVLVDQDPDGPGKMLGRKESIRFKLPNKPVVYSPKGWSTPVVESDIQISPKALFHLMFGDRSAVWQMLYRERQAQHIRQGPWIRENESHLHRAFEYSVCRKELFQPKRTFHIRDTQNVDVLSDHLCYVVTYRKTPWHLPQLRHFDMVTKCVISYEKRSRCKLAVYAKIEWSSRPLAAALIERQALQDIKSDASDIMDIVSAQVHRLGLGTNTKRAIEVFGDIGQQEQTIEFSEKCESMPLNLGFQMAQKSIAGLLFGAISSWAKYAWNLFLVSAALFVEWTWKLANANTILAVMLVVSCLFNLLLSSQPLGRWYREKHAINLIGRLGVGNGVSMDRMIALDHFEILLSEAQVEPGAGVSW